MSETGEAQRGLRIHHLHAENVLRLVVVDITPDEHAVVIGGKNGAGKSSVLNAIAMAIGGGKQVPAKALREGEALGKVVLDCGDFRLTRTWRKNDNGRLKIEAKEGVEAPTAQKVLDKLYDAIAIDPYAWARLCESTAGIKKQRDDLLAIAQLPIDLEGNLRDRKARYDERTLVGRDRDRVRGALESRSAIDAPEEKVDVGELLKAFQEGAKRNSRIRVADDAVRVAERELARAREDADDVSKDYREKVARAKREHEAWLEEIQRERKRREDAIRKLEEDLMPQAIEGAMRQIERQEAELDAARTEREALGDPVDVDAIGQRLDQAKEVNAAFEQERERRELAEELKRYEDRYERIGAEIKRLDAEREQALKNAELPIEGLGFDDNGVTYRGIPFSQLAQSERLRISIHMAMALNRPENGGKNLRVMLCRDGALLDEQNLALLCAEAREKDYQVWIETVGEGQQCTVVMEEGKVKRGRDE